MGESRGSHSLNSFSALPVMLDEVAAVDNGTSQQEEPKKARPYLKQPLIWIDLEMTGMSILFLLLFLLLFLKF